MGSLDDSLVNRAAPPGSMRYFSLLYAPEDRREQLCALYVIDAEIRESAQSANHDVAHDRIECGGDGRGRRGEMVLCPLDVALTKVDEPLSCKRHDENTWPFERCHASGTQIHCWTVQFLVGRGDAISVALNVRLRAGTPRENVVGHGIDSLIFEIEGL